jgi:hypothetical protein
LKAANRYRESGRFFNDLINKVLDKGGLRQSGYDSCAFVPKKDPSELLTVLHVDDGFGGQPSLIGPTVEYDYSGYFSY